MNTVQLFNVFGLRRCRLLSSLHLRQYHQLKVKSLETKCYVCRVTSRSVVPTRHFSFTEFYASISQSAPIVTFQNLLIDLHQLSGLPWWGLILLTTLGIRTAIVFPLTVHQHQVIARLANINAEVGKLVPELNKEVNMAKVMYHWDESHAKRVFRHQLRSIHNKYVIRDNCHPFKTVLLGFIQLPLWVMLSISLRNLTFMSLSLNPVPEPIAGLKNEGLLWFPDLTCPDSIIIPMLLLSVNLILTEMHALRQIGKGSSLQKILLNTSRVIIFVVAAAATINPSSVTFYWLCSSTFGLGQNILLMVPKFRRMLKIPSTGKESSTPFTDIAANLKKKFSK